VSAAVDTRVEAMREQLRSGAVGMPGPARGLEYHECAHCHATGFDLPTGGAYLCPLCRAGRAAYAMQERRGPVPVVRPAEGFTTAVAAAPAMPAIEDDDEPLPF
jgi:hypothetical protein